MLSQNRATMLYRVFKIMLFAAVLAAVMQAIRLLLVEPDEIAQACAVDPQQWQCQLRMLAINGFVRNLYGTVSLVAALLAWCGRDRLFSLLAILAMTAGMAGVILYDFELSALGLMLGAIYLARGEHALDAPMIERQS